MLGLFGSVVLAMVAAPLQEGKWSQVGEDGDWRGTTLLAAGDAHLVLLNKDGTVARLDKAGKKEKVGAEAAWKGVTCAAVSDGYLWTVDAEGNLARTDRSGKKESVGAAGAWKGAVFLAVLDGALWSVDGSGNLSRTDKAGKKDAVGASGGWKDTRFGAALGDMLWTIDRSGNLYGTDKSGRKTQVGAPGDWVGTAAMTAGEGMIYSVETSGTLYKTNTQGKWKQIGAEGDWEGTLSLAVWEGVLWSVDTAGSLYKTTINKASAGGGGAAVGGADYFPTKAGMVWTYVWEDKKEDVVTSEGTMEVDGQEVVSFLFDVQNGSSKRKEFYQVQDDGVYYAGGNFTAEEGEDELEETPSLVLPFDKAKGDTWETGTESKTLYEHLGEEELSVAGGKHKCIKIRSSYTIAGEKSVGTYWYAKGIGLVKYESVTGTGPGAAKSWKVLKSVKK